MNYLLFKYECERHAYTPALISNYHTYRVMCAIKPTWQNTEYSFNPKISGVKFYPSQVKLLAVSTESSVKVFPHTFYT